MLSCQARERFCSAFEVISSSAVSLVSSSSSLEFRAACLSNMRVGHSLVYKPSAPIIALHQPTSLGIVPLVSVWILTSKRV